MALGGPPDLVFGGTFRNIFDFNVYRAAANQAESTGSWRYVNQYTAEPHEPAFVHALYLATGHLARLTGLPTGLLLCVEQIVGRMALIAASYALAATLFPSGRARIAAWLLAVGGGSLALWSLLITLALGLPPREALYFEDDTFTALFSAPHLQFGLAAVLILLPALCQSQRRWMGTAFVAALFAVISLTVSYSLAPLLVWLWLSTLLWHRSRRGLVTAVIASAAAAPILLNNLATFALNPFWSAVLGRQNEVPTPDGPDFVVHTGAYLLVAPFVALAWRGRWTSERRLLALLAVLTLLAMFAPVPYQRRLGLGLMAELAVLSVAVLGWLFNRWPRWYRPLLLASALAFLPTNLASYAGIVSSALTNSPYPVYVATRPEVDAAQALNSLSGSSDVTLATLETSYVLPPEIAGRVVLGHPHETLQFRQKLPLTLRYFASSEPNVRSGILRELRATYVLVGPRERAIAQFDPARVPELDLVWSDSGGQVALFRVHGAAPPSASPSG